MASQPEQHQTDAPSVPLPNRRSRDELNAIHKNRPPIWSVEEAPGSDMPSAPLQAKCSAHGEERHGVCCKELIGEDERQLIDPDVVRDVCVSSVAVSPFYPCRLTLLISLSVIGLSDGLTVPFALTAGLSSLGDSRLVVLGGIAELIAGAISMGIGGFLASQAERDHYRYQRRSTAARVKRSCDGEIEREVTQVLGPVGVDEKICSTVAKCLRDLELESEGHGSDSGPPTIEDGGLKWSKEVGVTAFLIKFGEGLGALDSLCRKIDNPSSLRFCVLQRRSQTDECTCLQSLSVSVTCLAASSHYCPISSSKTPSKL
jgi:hypothetical protein